LGQQVIADGMSFNKNMQKEVSTLRSHFEVYAAISYQLAYFNSHQVLSKKSTSRFV